MNSAIPSDIDKPVLNDQIMAVRKQLPVILLLNLPLVLVLSWIYWPWVNHWSISFWAGCMLLVMVLRLVLFVFLAEHISRRLALEKHQWILVANSAISGLLWGWAGMLFFVPDRLDYQLIILMVLIVKGTGSVSSIVNSLPAFYAYFPVSMLPISIMFLLERSMTSVMLGLISLFFMLIVLSFGRNLNRTLLESLRMRYENQRLLEQSELAKRNAEAANHAKTRFLAAASHDLRQPIHALGLLLNVMEEQHSNDADAKITQQMRATVDSLQHLLDGLLDISRLDAGNVQVNLQQINILDITHRLSEEFDVLATDKGLRVNWPQQSQYIYTDSMLLEQVLRNLLANAIRYTPTGHIDVRCYQQQAKVRIEVEDTGIGIDDAQQREIFKEFYQVGNQQRDRNHGLGLGLAIVDRIMRLLGSQIELVSDIQSGSRFAFELDAGNSEAIEHHNQHTQSVTPGMRGELDSIVAIIEDDQEVSEAMQILLESWGCRTFIAEEGDSLLQQLSAAGALPDVIITDLQLGDNRDGIQEVNRVCHHLDIKVPVLVVTGNIQAEQLAQVKASGLPLLYKPVAPAKLRAFLRSQYLKQKNCNS